MSITFGPRPRRLIAGLATTAIAVVGVQLVATGTASAHANAVKGSVSCQKDGTYSVTWSVVNDYNATETVTVTGHSPAASSVAPATVSVAKYGTGSVTQSGIAGSATTASLTVTAKWSDGYSRDNAGSVSLPGTCKPGKAPAAPTVNDGSCVDRAQVAPSVTIPADAGVVYKLDGTAKDAGTYPVTPGSHTVLAASATYDLAAPTSWTLTVAAAPANCNDTVVPVAPDVRQSSCAGTTATAPALEPASTPGITYTVSRPGPYAAGDTVVVTATAKTGYQFSAPAASGWNFVDTTHETYSVTFADAPDCRAAAVPVAPKTTQARCQAAGAPSAPTLTVPDTTGVTYSVSSSAPYAAGQSVTITATAGAHHKFVAPAPSGWSFTDATHASYEVTFDAAPLCVSPEDPAITQSSCPATGSAATLPTLMPADTDGIEYSVDPAGPYTAGQTVTVVAVATGTHEFFTSAPGGWTYVDATHQTRSITFDAAPKCVQPVAPSFTDSECQDFAPTGASYVVPDTDGVDYYVGDVLLAAGTYPAVDGSSVTVVAQAQPGWTLTGTTSFTHTFGATPTCTTDATPVSPEFTDSVCRDYAPTDASYTISDTEGVDYYVDGTKVATGTHRAENGSSVTVVAVPQRGYVLVGDSTFSHTFPSAPVCTTTVEPAAPAFADNACTGHQATGAAFTIPTSEGVEYYVDGTSLVAGTYPATDGSTVTVTAKPLPGYVLAGPTTFEHTFGPTPDCTEGVSPAAPSFTDDTCSGYEPAGASYTIPVTDGVDYYVNGNQVVAGTYPAADGSSITVTTKPQDGYVLTGTTSFEHTFGPAPTCTTDVVATAPDFSDSACLDQAPTVASYTVPDTTGVDYRVNGGLVPAGSYPAADGTTVTITATAKDGYVLTGTTTFEHTFAAAPQACGTTEPVEVATAVTFADSVCRADGASEAGYTALDRDGVIYRVAGDVVAAGHHAAGDGTTVTVTAEAADGYVLTGTDSWTHEFPSTPNCLGVEPRSDGPNNGSGNEAQSGTEPAGDSQAPVTTGATAYTGAPIEQITLIGLALLLLGLASFLLGSGRGAVAATRVVTLARRRNMNA